ncbi:MAG: DUF2911 domain-containing protein [Bacteroidota bacterium]
MIKKVLIGLVVLVVLGFAGIFGLRIYTKSFSPEKVAQYEKDGLSIVVNYCSPQKKGREIFGDLVPFDQVWRTGANEPTTMKLNQPVKFEGQPLDSGTYSIWTIPKEDSWTIIFNSDIPEWGVTFSGQARREDSFDKLIVEDLPVIKTKDTFETFSIFFEEVGDEIEMILAWDQTLVVVPIER